MPNEHTAGGAQVPCISLLAQIVDEMLSHIDHHDSRAKPENRVTSQVQIRAWRRRKEDALANINSDNVVISGKVYKMRIDGLYAFEFTNDGKDT